MITQTSFGVPDSSNSRRTARLVLATSPGVTVILQSVTGRMRQLPESGAGPAKRGSSKGMIRKRATFSSVRAARTSARTRRVSLRNMKEIGKLKMGFRPEEEGSRASWVGVLALSVYDIADRSKAW